MSYALNIATRVAATFGLAFALLGAAAVDRPASATSCYGCYDDENGNEVCTEVEVQGQCNVITFCEAVGCGGSNDDDTIRLIDRFVNPGQPSTGVLRPQFQIQSPSNTLSR